MRKNIWKKKGFIFVPQMEVSWAKSYAHLPTAEIIDNKIIRVYFSTLDENNFGRVTYVDLDINNPQNVMYFHKDPVLELGPLGSFDDCGTVPSCILYHNDMKYLYYIGFQRCEKVPYMLFTGLAQSPLGQSNFQKLSAVPILDRTNDEPFSRSAPFIIKEGNQLKMWYWSCIKWDTREDGRAHYNNVIKYATSTDGINWTPLDKVCIEPNFQNEYAVGRPTVIKNNDLYKMWFSTRTFCSTDNNNSYFIGYAESFDGINWDRKDECAGIERSESGWDSEMVCYPYIIKVLDRYMMFYNGNQHGKTGFGYAVLEN